MSLLITTQERVNQAISVGMIQVDNTNKRAVILAPVNTENLTDDDWLDIIAASSEMKRALETISYTVQG